MTAAKPVAKRAAGAGDEPWWDGRRWVAKYRDGDRRPAVTVATPGEAGKRACAAKRDAKILELKINGPTPVDATMTVDAWLTRWLDDKKETVSAGTLKDYGDRANDYIRDHLGPKKLNQLTKHDIQAWLNRLRDKGGKKGIPLAADTRVGAYNVLAMALRASPVGGKALTGVELPPKRVRVDSWTVDEAERFLAYLDATDDRLVALWTVCLGIGLRQGEALGLRWQDLTLDGDEPWALIAVRLDSDTLELDTPKEQKAGAPPKLEAVALPAFVRDALVAHEHRQKLERLAAGPTWAGNPMGLVFTTEEGLPIRRTNVAKTFHLRAKAAGVRRIRPHDLRHTCATLLRARGVQLQVIQQVLRHTDIRMTQKYAHADPSTTVAAAGAMDGMFGASRKAATS